MQNMSHMSCLLFIPGSEKLYSKKKSWFKIVLLSLVGFISLSIFLVPRMSSAFHNSHIATEVQEQITHQTQQKIKQPGNEEQIFTGHQTSLKRQEIRRLIESFHQLRFPNKQATEDRTQGAQSSIERKEIERQKPMNEKYDLRNMTTVGLPGLGKDNVQDLQILTLPELEEKLKKKLTDVSSDDLLPATNTCATKEDIGNSCPQNPRGCVYQKQLPESIKERIQQLAGNQDLHIKKEHLETINSLQNQVDGYYDLIIVTAASSNHYQEVQEALKFLHDNFYPTRTNFTLVMYDLGLTEEERQTMKKHCKCQVIVFPFEKFPEHVRKLKCFGWKPVTIKAHIGQSSTIAWFDASIRLHNITEFNILIERAKKRGVQQRFYGHKEMNPRFTLQEMFHYYGDEPCAHVPYIQAETGFGIYHNEALVRQAIIDPWVACGLAKKCGCPRNQARVQSCPRGKAARNLPPYGRCHRSDQSSLSIILAKLFHRAYRYVVVDTTKSHSVRRGSKLDYFGAIERNATDYISSQRQK